MIATYNMITRNFFINNSSFVHLMILLNICYCQSSFNVRTGHWFATRLLLFFSVTELIYQLIFLCMFFPTRWSDRESRLASGLKTIWSLRNAERGFWLGFLFYITHTRPIPLLVEFWRSVLTSFFILLGLIHTFKLFKLKHLFGSYTNFLGSARCCSCHYMTCPIF